MSTLDPDGHIPEISVFFQELAQLAAAPSLAHFRSGVGVENKNTDDFDPVTEADRNTESVIREKIRAKFPEHGIIGEEFGSENLDCDYVWVIDPIDGTRAYISGLPTWGTLVGLTYKGRAVAGFMSQPYLGEVFMGAPGGSYFAKDGGATMPINVSQVKTLADAKLMTTTPALFQGEASNRYFELERQVRLPRYGFDCYAYAMLAAGHIDLVVEPGLQSYDIVGLIGLIEQAGGIVTTWDGERPENGGNIIAAATTSLHAAALKIINGAG
ncbi:MAG: histidinol-phosphatase [Pseudomonadota bacterium]